MIDVKRMYKKELEAFLKDLNEQPYRADQIYRWLHQKQASTFDEMTDLSGALREKLKNETHLTVLKIKRVQESRTDGTRKYLFLLEDGNLIEAVLMKYRFGNSLCISTQVGCRMGCKFCASTLGGLVRNLTASEMLEEVYTVLRSTGEEIGHVVLMGSGEPLDNYEEVIRFLRQITDPEGKNMSIRHITLSTSGLTSKIRALAEEGLPVTLALSLHAADPGTRGELMPVARTNPLPELLKACDYYFEKTGRRVTYEYAVIRDKNDSREEAEKLGALLKGKNAHVNLIPVNPVRERDMRRPELSGVREFQKHLEKNGINATIRRELGQDIDGACGQLRARVMEEENGVRFS